jgi:hypothetical protein
MIGKLVKKADVPTLRAAWWTLRALRGVRRSLRRNGVYHVTVPTPPPLPVHSERGVNAVLRRRGATCLERSLVLQRWLAARGDPRDLIIGVIGPSDGFKAHAWLEGEHDQHSGTTPFRELTRIAARGAG